MLKLVLHRHSWGFLRFQYHEKSPFSRLLKEECDTRIKERAAELMEQIRSMSKDPTDILQTMNLVDSIQLLGLDYRFEKEISEALNHAIRPNLHANPSRRRAKGKRAVPISIKPATQQYLFIYDKKKEFVAIISGFNYLLIRGP